MTVLQLAAKLVIFIAIGYVSRKLKVMQDGFDKMLTRFLMGVPLPCMIINSFNVEFSTSDLVKCPQLLLLALLSLCLCFAVAQTVYIKMGRTGLAKCSRFALMFTNFTFFGLPVVSELYGAQGVFYYVIFTLPMRVAFYGGAPLLLGKQGQKPDLKETLKKFLCEPVVAVFIGFFLYVTQIHLPAVLQSVLSSVGAMASPLGLMLCGTIIADASWSGLLRYPCVFWVAAARLLVMPAIALGFFLLLGIDKSMIKAMIFFFAMPVPSFLPTFTLRYNPDEVEGRIAGGYMVVVSTLLCVATVPLWAYILELI